MINDFFEKVKDHFNKIGGDVKERLTNPFMISFLLVWFYHNWELILMLYTFPPQLTYVERVCEIKWFLADQNTKCELFLKPLAWALVSVFVYGSFSLLGTFITKLFTQYGQGWIGIMFKQTGYKTMREYNEKSKQLDDVESTISSYKNRAIEETNNARSERAQKEEWIDKHGLEKTKVDNITKVNQKQEERIVRLERELELNQKQSILPKDYPNEYNKLLEANKILTRENLANKYALIEVENDSKASDADFLNEINAVNQKNLNEYEESLENGHQYSEGLHEAHIFTHLKTLNNPISEKSKEVLDNYILGCLEKNLNPLESRVEFKNFLASMVESARDPLINDLLLDDNLAPTSKGLLNIEWLLIDKK